MNSTKKTMQVCGRETRPILKFVKNLLHLVYLSIFAKCLWWRYRIGCTNVWRLMCYSWAIRPSFILRLRSPVRYNLITKSLLQNVSYIHFFAIYRFFVYFFVSVSFLVYLHDVSLRNRTRVGPVRSLFVLSRFPIQPPSLVLLHTHTFISSTRPICRDTYTHMRMYIYV